MSRGTYSGDEVVKVLVNNGPYELDRINGSHYVLKWYPPDHHTDSEERTVVVPRHDEIKTGTLHKIGRQAEMKSFDEFLDWLDRNI